MELGLVLKTLTPEQFEELTKKAFEEAPVGESGFKVENIRKVANRIEVGVWYWETGKRQTVII